MGEVWRVRDVEFDVELIAKVVPEGGAEANAALLRREFEITNSLVHRNILRAHELHEAEGRLFFTADLVSNGDLGQLRGGSLRRIVQIAIEVADALEFAHSQGVVHRDLKCSNILIDSDGSPRLSDFGIATRLEPSNHETSIIGGGTTSNQSPQQAAGEPPTVADDIYGLGTVIFELVVGAPAFPAEVTGEDRYGRRPPRMSGQRSVPEELDDLVASMISNRPSDRPSQMGEVKNRLNGVGASLDATTGPMRDGAIAPIRVNAPPRVSEPRVTASQRILPTKAKGGSKRWSLRGLMTLAAFAFLGLIAIGVFVFLPRWVARNPPSIGVDGETVEPEAQTAGAPLVVAETSSLAPTDERSEPSPEPPSVVTPEVAIDLSEESLRARARSQQPADSGGGTGSIEQPTRSESAQIEEPKRATPTDSPPSSPKSNRAFSTAMSDGLQAFEQNQFSMAAAAFRRALDLRPDSKEAAEGLARADLRLRLQTIEAHRARALEMETQERWKEAEAEYSQVLEIDPTIRFAIQGHKRAADRAKLGDQLDFHIANPERMVSQKVLEEATDLLGRARNTQPEGPVLSRQIRQLEDLVAVASKPITIRLVSDNVTDVVVYQVGALGRFEQRQLELRPGSYTAVGSREGYRDVRRVFKVGPGESSNPVVVRCEEKI